MPPSHVSPGFEPVRDAFESFHARGWDIGSAFTAYVNGRVVANLSAGTRDAAADALAYDGQTVQLVASAAKFAESVCIALLVDRGLLGYDDRVVDHWPEFAAGDARKARVTVRQLMMHRAGLPVFDRKLGDGELFDVGARAAFLERQPQVSALFAPEPSRSDWRDQEAPPQAYHAVSRGLYASELLRRVDPSHRTLGKFFDDELGKPLELDFWIGFPKREESRLSPTHSAPGPLMALLDLATAPPPNPSDPRFALFDYEIEFLRQLLTHPDSLQHRALSCDVIRLGRRGWPDGEIRSQAGSRVCIRDEHARRSHGNERSACERASAGDDRVCECRSRES